MAKRILLVDDEPLIVKGLKYTLEQEGFETDSAADGDEALTKFFAGHYDFILLDVMLPKVDGISVCQRIREHSNVPIIMLTAKGERDGQDSGAGIRRGRLYDQALQYSGGQGAHQDHPAPYRRVAARTTCAASSASTIWRSTPSTAPSRWAATKSA